jgi:hypothetical protein
MMGIDTGPAGLIGVGIDSTTIGDMMEIVAGHGKFIGVSTGHTLFLTTVTWKFL